MGALVRRIVEEARWPELWLQHWVTPIYKKKAVFQAGNYRGVHLSSQLSKVAERAILPLWQPHLVNNGSFGDNQFAYQKGRGARDAVAWLTLTWIRALNNDKKVADYCSDVTGAFDRVNSIELVAKLRKRGLHEQMVRLLESWLRERQARVVVSGKCSDPMSLHEMVFQGTVLGPSLWNTFFCDSGDYFADKGYVQAVYADGLNAFREFDGNDDSDLIWSSLFRCQAVLHSWGRDNQVTFDAAKESMHILQNGSPSADESYRELWEDFKILGVWFDCKLTMRSAVKALAREASRRVTEILRARRSLSADKMITLYKANVLGFIEYRTAAIYHADSWILASVDRVQVRFLDELGISEKQAALQYNLAPLSARRDIAMLGVIFRSVHDGGPLIFSRISSD